MVEFLHEEALETIMEVLKTIGNETKKSGMVHHVSERKVTISQQLQNKTSNNGQRRIMDQIF